jgi:hypothetical protein
VPRQYTESELWLAIRQERAHLTEEHVKITKRLREIDARLDELDKAENILEGGL